MNVKKGGRHEINVLICHLDDDESDPIALKYLILYSNTVQSSFQFSLVQYFEDPFLDRLSSREEVPYEWLSEERGAFMRRYRAFLEDEYKDFPVEVNDSAPLVILSTATLDNNYFLVGNRSCGIVALGNWEKWMAPPSMFEFLLSVLYGTSVLKVCHKEQPVMHGLARGCCFDFSVHLADARYRILSGYVCDQCAEVLAKNHNESFVSDVKTLMRMEWLGTVSKPSDASVIVRKLGHDLYRTEALRPSLRERLFTILETDGVRELIRLVGIGLIALISALIATSID